MPANVFQDSGFGVAGSIGGLVSSTFGIPIYAAPEPSKDEKNEGSDASDKGGFGGFGGAALP